MKGSNWILYLYENEEKSQLFKIMEFKTINNNKLMKIAENMPAINRATAIFGKGNSQITSKFMSLQMISFNPYRTLKQILAQIERKRSALKENIFKLQKDIIKLDRLSIKKDKMFLPTYRSETPNLDLEEINISIQKKASSIADTSIYIEAAFKEIGQYQNTYNEILESKGIRENWDEADMEKAEIEEHIKTGILHTIRDVEVNGRLGMGTTEYLFQFGINPQVALRLVQNYLVEVNKIIDEGKAPNIQVLYDFLNKMYELFKNEYKHSMEKIGIKNLISEEYLYIEEGNNEKEN